MGEVKRQWRARPSRSGLFVFPRDAAHTKLRDAAHTKLHRASRSYHTKLAQQGKVERPLGASGQGALGGTRAWPRSLELKSCQARGAPNWLSHISQDGFLSAPQPLTKCHCWASQRQFLISTKELLWAMRFQRRVSLNEGCMVVSKTHSHLPVCSLPLRRVGSYRKAVSPAGYLVHREVRSHQDQHHSTSTSSVTEVNTQHEQGRGLKGREYKSVSRRSFNTPISSSS